MILSSEISVTSDPVAMRLDEVRLLLDVWLLHVLHRLIRVRRRWRHSASAMVASAEVKLTLVFVRMIVAQQWNPRLILKFQNNIKITVFTQVTFKLQLKLTVTFDILVNVTVDRSNKYLIQYCLRVTLLNCFNFK